MNHLSEECVAISENDKDVMGPVAVLNKFGVVGVTKREHFEKTKTFLEHYAGQFDIRFSQRNQRIWTGKTIEPTLDKLFFKIG